MSKEFNFTDNKDWLLPFLEAFKKQNEITGIDDFAIKNVEKIFKKNMIESVVSVFSGSSNEEPNWKECAKSYTLNEIATGCRKSPGFDDKSVPKKFNYNTSKEKDSDEYKQSVHSYDYLRYSDDINKILIDTPSSDYTRRDDVLHKYRLIDYLREKKVEGYKSYTWVDCILDAYDKEIDTIVKKISKIPDFKDFYFLSLHFHGDLNADYNMNFINGLEEERQKTRDKEPSSQNKETSTKNSFFNKKGDLTGGKNKKKNKKSKKIKSKTSNKTSKKKTIKRKCR